MKKHVTSLVTIMMTALFFCHLTTLAQAQDDQASLLLDLKKTRATYEIAREKLQNDTALYENKAISESEFIQSKNGLLQAEVEYQKKILQVISQQSYVIIEKAVKYQNANSERRVRITLRSTMEGNQEYLEQFEQHFDVFTPEMRSGKIYNIFVSLINLEDQTIIGTPYEVRIPSLEVGKTADADFGLLRDVESLQVSLNYSGRKDSRNIYLEKDSSADIVDIYSSQFSQEADIGSQATYDLTLERFSDSDDSYTLFVAGLPRQVSYDFIDSSTNARLSQIKFMQGVNTKNLSLRVYLPDREDENIVMDKPLIFHAFVLSRDEHATLSGQDPAAFSQEDIDAIQGGKVRLELVPRGVGRIEVRAPSLYHEITAGDSIGMDITVRNDGTRRLDNIRISTDNPLNWRSIVEPDLIRSLDPEKEEIVHLRLIPPTDVGVGAQEVKIRTEALADNRRVETEDKTVRIQVQAKTPLLWTLTLVFALVGLVLGIVVFGIRISRR